MSFWVLARLPISNVSTAGIFKRDCDASMEPNKEGGEIRAMNKICLFSISLSSYACETGFEHILSIDREHVGMDAQIFNLIEILSLSERIALSRHSSAHQFSLFPKQLIIHTTHCIVTTLPTPMNTSVVAGMRKSLQLKCLGTCYVTHASFVEVTVSQASRHFI